MFKVLDESVLWILWDSKWYIGVLHFNIFRIIYDKIDKDHDNQVTEEELSEWIQYVQTRYIRLDTDRQWTNYVGTDNGTALTWNIYKDKTYGHISG